MSCARFSPLRHSPSADLRPADFRSSVIVTPSGHSGFNGEHSMLDGTPTLRMNEFVLSSLALGRIDLEPSARPHATPLGGKVEELKWILDEKAKEDVKEAKREHEALMRDHQMAALHFTGYGSESSPSSRTLLQSRLLTKNHMSRVFFL